MKSTLRSVPALALVALALLPVSPARAQFTSAYNYVTIPGNFNGYDTYTPRMTLISNGIWQAYVTLYSYTNPTFLFSTTNFATTWKETNQPSFALPVAGIAEKDPVSGWSDIAVNTNFTGTLQIRFNESTGGYVVRDNSASTSTNTEPWINELHYDNGSSDVNEGVEIAGRAGTDLAGYALYFYDGANGRPYKTNLLSGVILDQFSGFGVTNLAISGIQDGGSLGVGAGDAIALVKRGATTSIVQFLSYEGSFMATTGPAMGVTAVDIGLDEDPFPAAGVSLQLTGIGGSYSDFQWTGPTNHTRGIANIGQTFISWPLVATVSVSNLRSDPSSPLMTNTVHLLLDVAGGAGVSNLSVTAFYRTNYYSRFQPIPMTLLSGTTYRTVTPIPTLPPATIVDYYGFVNFDGPGTNSPTLFPAGAPASNLNSYIVGSGLAGSVWINELNPAGDWAAVQYTNEYIEIAARAGMDLANWVLECYDQDTNLYARYRIPTPAVTPNQASGYGFYVIGDTGTPGLDMVFTNAPDGAGDHLRDSGALRLIDPQSNLVHAVRYGPDATNFSLFATSYAGDDYSIINVDADYTLQMVGNGSYAGSFTWSTNEVTYAGTPNAINSNQTFIGGNTNPLPPSIICPADITLDCVSRTIPPPSVTSVFAVGYCGTGGVTVTHVGDVTNSGTGCYGNPKMITRTYRAVSQCGTTSTCSQIILIEDKTPPTLICPTQTLVNAGFETGTTDGWTFFGDSPGTVMANRAFPRTGFMAARMQAPVNAILLNSTATEDLDGAYYNGPVWGAAGARTGKTATAVGFDGVNDRADVPWSADLNGSNFTFSLWARVTGGQGTYRSPITSRENSPQRGYIIYAGNDNNWQFWTGQGSGWHYMTGPAVSLSNWVHIAGSYDAGTQTKKLYINGTSAVYTASGVAFQPNTQLPLRIGAGSTEVPTGDWFFPGQIDDVQIYSNALTDAQVLALYTNAGTGVTSVVAHYRMDDRPSTNRTAGLYQTLPTDTGQVWQAGIYVAQPSSDPLTGSNAVQVSLEFLNTTGAVVAVSNAPLFDAATPRDTYTRFAVRATAPSNAAQARLRVAYQQDSVYSRGSVYIDDAVMTPFVITAGVSCAVIPDYRWIVDATDTCSSVTISQSPAPGQTAGGSNIVITFTASDACGLTAQGSIVASVEDNVPPSITNKGPAQLTLTCTNDLPAADPSRMSATDTCSGASVTLESTIISGSPCDGPSFMRVIYKYRATDSSGNSATATETFTIIDTNAPPYVYSMLDLTNGGFEAGTLANWSTFGTGLAVTNIEARTGSKHAVVTGVTNGTESWTGLYQDLAAGPGQVWRAAGYALQHSTRPLQNGERLELKIEFFNTNGVNIQTLQAGYFTSNNHQDVYVPISVTATSPAQTVRARCTTLIYQSAGITSTPGEVYLDDFTLNRHMFSINPDQCLQNTFVPDLTPLPQFTGCGTVNISQYPPAALQVTNYGWQMGWNTCTVYGASSCGLTSACTIALYYVDDTSPIIIGGPANTNVLSVTNIPPADTNSVFGYDSCNAITIAHVGDVSNGGTGAAGDPMRVVRTYRVMDTSSNAVLYRQVITVEGLVPTAPTNVSVRGVTLGTNLVVQSVGTNTWRVTAEYATNLLGTPQWYSLPAITNVFLNGTNTTRFDPPLTNARPAIIRILQIYP